MRIILVGNKIDLEGQREFSNEEALEKGKHFELPLIEVSAFDSTNVNQAFYDLIKEIYKEFERKIGYVQRTEAQHE